MAVISRDLGPVTAYAAAVNRGYTGTRAEFEELMASYATVAQEAGESASAAADSASDAESSASAAATSASDASSFASAANTSAGNASNAATAAGIAQTAAESARNAAQSAQTAAEAAQEGAETAVSGFDSAVTAAISDVNVAGTNQKELAKRQAEKSEAWAVGEINGEDVGVSDPAYHNNAKYYAESVGTAATTATTKASEAAQSAENAASSAAAAEDAADRAEAAAEQAEGAIEVDDTLSVEGRAADAKKTGDEIGDLKEDLGVFNFFKGMQSGFIPTSGTTYPTTNASYPNATYVIVDLIAGQSLKITGYASANTAGRSRCIVNGEIVSSVAGNTDNYTTTANLSNSLNNCTITAKKDIQIALMLLNGIVISGTRATIDGYNSVSELLFDTYNSTFSLTDSINSLSDDLDKNETDLKELAVKTFDVRDLQYLVPNIPNINKVAGYSVSAGATSVELDVNANYDSYWHITKEPLTLYAVPTSGQYYALGVLTGASGSWEEHTNYNIMRGTAGTRYRSNNNNLPTQNTPLTVPAGTLLVYTFPASSYYSAVYEDQVSNVLDNAVRLNDGQLAQIPNQKKVYFKYSATSGGDSSNEHIDVYIPYKEGFVHYLVVHTESQTINADVWRISIAYITDSAFNDVTQITTSGEWECAIHLPDRDDFSGGYAHGDEVLISDPTFFKDGIPVDITDFTDYTPCDEFTFVERTNMYDPADNTRAIVQHGNAHIFGTEKLKIQQSLLWLVDTALTNTYLAMLPIAKAVSSHFYTNARHIVTAIGNTSHTESKATEAVIYGDDISCKFSVPVYSPVSAYFFETDNGGSAYNKCYFAVAATSVTHGDVWMTETDYEFS